VEQPLGERLALEELEDLVAAAVGEGAEAEDVDDVGVADLVDRARLLHEAQHRLAPAREAACDDLDRGALADQRMHRGVDRRHAAGAEDAGHRVVTDARADLERDLVLGGAEAQATAVVRTGGEHGGPALAAASASRAARRRRFRTPLVDHDRAHGRRTGVVEF
jgi:hypothetical protein